MAGAGSLQHIREVNMAMAQALCDCPTLKLETLRSDAYSKVIKAQSRGAITTKPDRETMRHYTICTYDATRRRLLARLDKVRRLYGPLKFAHFATDIWTAKHTPDSYATFDCRFFDPEDGEMVCVNLACRRFNVKHTHLDITQSINEILQEYGFEEGDAVSHRVTMRHEEAEEEMQGANVEAEAAALEAAIEEEQAATTTAEAEA